MKNHTKVYLKYFGYSLHDEDQYIPCEWGGIGCQNKAVDINHIIARGMGGSKLVDYIENLVAMCRHCHLEFEAGRVDKEELRTIHLLNL